MQIIFTKIHEKIDEHFLKYYDDHLTLYTSDFKAIKDKESAHCEILILYRSFNLILVFQ